MKSCNEPILSGKGSCIAGDNSTQNVKSGLFFPLISKNNNTHIEIHLPLSKLNQHLKQILRQPKDHYRKIDRGIGRSLSYLGKGKGNEEAFKFKILQTSRQQSPSINKLTVKSEITKILNNYESSLLDHKQSHFAKRLKRPLIDKKLITLLPQIPDGKKHKRDQYISIVDRYSQISEQYQSLNTIEYPNYEDFNREQFQIEPTIDSLKKIEILKPKEEITKAKNKKYQSLTLQPRRSSTKLKKQKNEGSIQLKQQDKYEPWKLEYEQNQDLF